MPVITEWPALLSLESLWKWHGIKCRGGVHPKFKERAPDVLAEAGEMQLIQPRLAFEIFSVEDVDDLLAEMPKAADRIKTAEKLAVAVATIGPGVEQRINKLFAEKKALKALVYEELGVAAMFKLSNEVLKRIQKGAAEYNLKASGPIHPGDNDADLSLQHKVYKLTDASRIDVSVIESGMLKPAKSLSIIVGYGEDLVRWKREENCKTCQVRDVCRYRNRETELVMA
ncbi:MAG: hypothetical protein CMM74_12165 [Rhodospirillaceae bacterium]|nr:hypothetical protein [Rhodospirillaceae bacterium]